MANCVTCEIVLAKEVDGESRVDLEKVLCEKCYRLHLDIRRLNACGGLTALKQLVQDNPTEVPA